jgi:hypothetical protein
MANTEAQSNILLGTSLEPIPKILDYQVGTAKPEPMQEKLPLYIFFPAAPFP